MGQEANTIPKICAKLEDHQEGHNSTMVEVEGEIVERTVFVLIEPRSTHNYISLELFKCALWRNQSIGYRG